MVTQPNLLLLSKDCFLVWKTLGSIDKKAKICVQYVEYNEVTKHIVQFLLPMAG